MTQQHDNAKATAPVYTDKNPEFPFLMYNHETRQTRGAKDKDDKAKLAKEGFVDDPYAPEDVDALTQAEVQQLQALLAKAAKALIKLGYLSEHVDKKESAKKQ